jgi:lipopolysaccharide export LptBFGC system permease protein LptF
MTWKILSILAVISLAISYRFSRRNSVWGGLTLGTVIGFIGAIVSVFQKNGFNWVFVGKSVIVCILVGVGAELLGVLGDFLKERG